MEKKAWFQEVSLAKVFETMVDLEGARAALRFLSGKGAGPLSPDAPPPPEVEAELQAFAEALTPERLSGAIRLAPEGVHLFGGAFFLLRGRVGLRGRVAAGPYVGGLDVVPRPLRGDLGGPGAPPAREEEGDAAAAKRRHPAYRLLLSYGDYLALTHTPRDRWPGPGSWTWTLAGEGGGGPGPGPMAPGRGGLPGLPRGLPALGGLTAPWNPAAYLHARRLLALDGERFFREWRRHPEALLSFLSLGHVSLDWEAYRGLLRRGYALLRAQGWGEGEARWLLAYPSLTRGVRKEPPFAEGRVPRSFSPGFSPSSVRAGSCRSPGGGSPGCASWTTRIGASSWASWRRTRTPRPPRRRPWWRCCGPGAAGRGRRMPSWPFPS